MLTKIGLIVCTYRYICCYTNSYTTCDLTSMGITPSNCRLHLEQLVFHVSSAGCLKSQIMDRQWIVISSTCKENLSLWAASFTFQLCGQQKCHWRDGKEGDKVSDIMTWERKHFIKQHLNCWVTCNFIVSLNFTSKRFHVKTVDSRLVTFDFFIWDPFTSRIY